MRTGGEPALYHICPSHVKRNYHKFCQFGVMCIDPGHKAEKRTAIAVSRIGKY
ncbi:hypothetical protein P692DRAFT_201787795 [Suillus brevipes Sb2]|nr:hypothetical protein P692DRAFT_201787795 [Suillus brevipes Sb2]